MSPKCEVATLGELALYAVVTQVTHALSDDEGAYYDVVTNYHQYTPPEVLEDMLRDILSNENLDAGTRFSCLQVLLQDNVRKLETGMFPTSYWEPIIRVVKMKGSGLHHLNLKGVWIKDNSLLLKETLENLPQLKVLHVPHIVDDDMLKAITNCTQLKVLNISGECSFTTQALATFCRTLRTNKSFLKIVDVGSYGEENKPHESIADLIESLPHLVSLSSYSFVGKSLLKIYQRNSSFKSKLRYLHDTNTTLEISDAIYHLCPNLEDLNLDTPEPGVVETIKRFQALGSLKLTRFQCDEVHLLLRNWKNVVYAVKLNLGRGIMDLSSLTLGCPNLCTLELYKMEFLTHTSEQLFPKLEDLEVTYSEMSSACLRYLLSSAPHLSNLMISDPIKLTDGDLYRLCADCRLLRLQKLWFTNARYLTVNAVELLMGHCPCLRVLGQLTGWNVTADDFALMQAVIQSTNTDLTLLPVENFP